MIENFDMISKFTEFKNTFSSSRKYWLAYFILIAAVFLSMAIGKSFSNLGFQFSVFILVSILGIFTIVFYFMHNSDEDLYKVAFVVILCFGLICSIMMPIGDVSDEGEHLIRAEITSNGIIFPHWSGEDQGLDRLYNLSNEDRSTLLNPGVGYDSISSMYFFSSNWGLTVFDTTQDTDKINYNHTLLNSAFEQNPFYGYLPQAIGIFIAKLLDLNVIWILWLGRMFNLVCYAGIISYAIKKVPILKIPLLGVACIPISIYQASSVSIDSLMIGLGILVVAYFIYMCKPGSESVNVKDIVIFTILCLLLGLCKLPYLLFIFLLIFVPKNNFKTEYRVNLLILLSILVVSIIGFMWSQYSSQVLLHSWRSSYTQINATNQIQYLLHNPSGISNFFIHIFSIDLNTIFNGVFNFYNGGNQPDGAEYSLITIAIQLFLGILLFSYPSKENFDLKTKWGAFVLMVITYIGICFAMLLGWANVGQLNLGLQFRYFIPLFALIPIISRLNNFENEKYDYYSIMLIVIFLSAMIFRFSTKFYL